MPLEVLTSIGRPRDIDAKAGGQRLADTEAEGQRSEGQRSEGQRLEG